MYNIFTAPLSSVSSGTTETTTKDHVEQIHGAAESTALNATFFESLLSA